MFFILVSLLSGVVHCQAYQSSNKSPLYWNGWKDFSTQWWDNPAVNQTSDALLEKRRLEGETQAIHGQNADCRGVPQLLPWWRSKGQISGQDYGHDPLITTATVTPCLVPLGCMKHNYSFLLYSIHPSALLPWILLWISSWLLVRSYLDEN